MRAAGPVDSRISFLFNFRGSKPPENKTRLKDCPRSEASSANMLVLEHQTVSKGQLSDR